MQNIFVQIKSILKYFEGNYWFIIGILMYLGTSISSIIKSFNYPGLNIPTDLFSILYMIIDWLAACIIYFYIGALFGFLIDAYIAKRKKQKLSLPLWFFLTAGLWIISSITAAILNKSQMSAIVLIIFPLAYGLFFLGIAYTMIFPQTIVQSYIGKFFFDIFFIGVFVYWLYLTFKTQNSTGEIIKNNIKKILLIIIFIIFFIGFIGCARTI